jgi:hypothetical protein
VSSRRLAQDAALRCSPHHLHSGVQTRSASRRATPSPASIGPAHTTSVHHAPPGPRGAAAPAERAATYNRLPAHRRCALARSSARLARPCAVVCTSARALVLGAVRLVRLLTLQSGTHRLLPSLSRRPGRSPSGPPASRLVSSARSPSARLVSSLRRRLVSLSSPRLFCVARAPDASSRPAADIADIGNEPRQADMSPHMRAGPSGLRASRRWVCVERGSQRSLVSPVGLQTAAVSVCGLVSIHGTRAR